LTRNFQLREMNRYIFIRIFKGKLHRSRDMDRAVLTRSLEMSENPQRYGGESSTHPQAIGDALASVVFRS
jgi:hypothetical protein